jgi:hypothetical protein
MHSIDIKAQVERVFSDAPRPAHFTNYRHCEECAEHDETLRSFDRDTIGLEQLGNPGWDPMCFVLPDAFKYYFPAMVRLALDSTDSDSYLDQFLFHMTYEGEGSRFFGVFSKSQRQVVLSVLRHIRANMASAVELYDLETELEDAIDLWVGLTADA